MIELYEGRLGGGKTYSAVVRMVDHIRRGGLVCTNVELIWPAIKAFIAAKYRLVAQDDQFIAITDEQIGLFHRHTPTGTAALPVLVVIDEAHLTFNARDFAKTDKLYRETLTFLTQSRKVNTDIIFIAQSVLNMDKQFMRLVQFIWRFRDLARWKVPGLGISWPLKQILAVQFDYDGRTILQRWFVRKDPAVFALYRTDHIVKPFPRLEVVQTHRTLEKIETRSKMAKYLIPVAIIAGIIAVFYLVHSFKTNLSPSPAVASAQQSQTPSGGSRKKETEKENGLYDIYRQHFVAWNGPAKTLKTAESGWFQVGEMSALGFVTAVSDRRAKVFQPNGRDGWVVATQDYVAPKGESSQSGSPTPRPSVSPTPPGATFNVLVAPLPTPSSEPTKMPITRSR